MWGPVMRVNVLYDEQGAILAAAAVTEGGDEPVALEGERSEVFNVPDDITEHDLAALLQRFSVDVRAGTLKESGPPAQG